MVCCGGDTAGRIDEGRHAEAEAGMRRGEMPTRSRAAVRDPHDAESLCCCKPVACVELQDEAAFAPAARLRLRASILY